MASPSHPDATKAGKRMRFLNPGSCPFGPFDIADACHIHPQLTSDQIMAWLQYFVAFNVGSCTYLLRLNGTVVEKNKDQMKQILQCCSWAQFDGNPIRASAILTSAYLPVFERSAFLPQDPHPITHEPDPFRDDAVYNRWKVLYPEPPSTFEPDMTRVQPFLDHWYLGMANEDTRVFDACMQFMAHIVQYPHLRMGWCMVLVGDQGVGKNIAMAPLQRALAGHAITEFNHERLSGKFNSILKDKLLIVLDEFDATKQADTMKYLVTTTMLNIEEKYMPTESNEPAYLNLVVLSNRNRIPVKIEATDRRYFVVDTGNYAKRNPDFVTRYAQMYLDTDNRESLENCKHVYMYLARLQGVPQNMGDAPMTPLKEQFMSINQLLDAPVLSFFRDALECPDCMSADEHAAFALEDGAEYDAATIAAKYGIWTVHAGVARPKTPSSMSKDPLMLRLPAVKRNGKKYYTVNRASLGL